MNSTRQMEEMSCELSSVGRQYIIYARSGIRTSDTKKKKKKKDKWKK